MLGLKVQLKDAEKWKKYIVINDIIDKEYYYLKDKKYIYFPVNKKFVIVHSKDGKEDISFVDKDFSKSIHKGTLKENLSKSLTSEELAFVKTAHDIIGNIAIVEIPKDLESREKLIAETLLTVNSQIKTVLKKANIHEGIFRTQKMIYLAGVNTKETIYRENNVQLKLDVEKVYFSVRLGNERKRIMQLVKPGEEILVMFSGAAPYPVVLSKNTKARHITGIEINPDGHKYGLENLRLNKIHNVLLINEDVHKAIPTIYQKIIGLKSAIIPPEMDMRLKKNPSIIEIHLFENSLDDDKDNNKLVELENQIKILKEKGLTLFIHVPFKIKGEAYDLTSDDAVIMCKKIGELCKKYFTSAIIHLAHDYEIVDEKLLYKNLSSLEQYFDYFYFENLMKAFHTKEEILRVARKAKFKNICIDLAHLYITYEDNKKMESTIKVVQKEFNTYFHVADHDKVSHTCELGKGFIDFNMLLPLINKGVVEVSSKNEANPKEMLDSYDRLKEYSKKCPKTYDRIIMPLPKTADEFLDDALQVSKKGTIIHFYDFLPPDKFDEATKKIDKACKKRGLKYKILETVKCGQHAPYIYRICVDFKIL
jgi:tRNA (guanine37-N1)-methyltransferase